MAESQDEARRVRLFPILEQEAFLELIRTADALSRELEELFKPSGLSATQYNVLRILRGAANNGLACGQIAGRMITRDPDMTRLLDRLEKRALILRSRDTADRRIVRARISASGLATLETLDDPLLELHRRQLRHMGEDRLRQLIALLEQARKQPETQPSTCDGR